MRTTLTPHTRRWLDIQGFDNVCDRDLAPAAPWLRLAFLLCAVFAAVGTVVGSTTILLGLAVIAAIAAASPVHPFDLIYNYGIRRVRGTGRLPRRGAPVRFACGMGTVMLVVTAWTFAAGHTTAGYILGGLLVCSAVLVGTTDICIPSLIYRSIFGWRRATSPVAAAK